MAILVTGSNGFAGINIVRKLAEKGELVVGLDNSPPIEETKAFLGEVEGNVQFVSADIVNPKEVLEISKEYNIQRFVHAAAVTPTMEAEKANPSRVIDVNLMGTVNVLEAARKLSAKRFVFVSSSGMYGAPSNPAELVFEDTPLRLDKLYAICKYSSELIVKRYRDLYGLSTVTGRMCAIFGPMERTSISRENPSMIFKLLGSMFSGKHLRVKGGDLVNDYTHAEDAATIWSHLTLDNNLLYDLYHVSAGIAYPLKEALKTIHSIEPNFNYTLVTGNEESDIEMMPDGERGALDITRARENFGFEPKFNLLHGLQNYIEWSKAFPSLSPKI